MEHGKAAAPHCKSIFKGDSSQQRKEGFTRKLAELINAQERAKNIHITKD